MGSRRRLRFVRAQTALMLVAVVVLAALESLSLDLFFAVSFVGFLVLLDRLAGSASASRWRGRLRWVILLGVVLFAAIVALRMLSLFEIEVI